MEGVDLDVEVEGGAAAVEGVDIIHIKRLKDFYMVHYLVWVVCYK